MTLMDSPLEAAENDELFMTFPLWQIILLVVFFSLSILFAASETALVSLSRPRLKKMISQRPQLAAALSNWLSTPQYLLTTILVGNTLSNVFVTLLAVEIAFGLMPKLHAAWVETITWLVMTIVLFICADFIPKSLARSYPERVTLASIQIVSALTRWTTPLWRMLLRFLDRFPMFEGAPVGRLSEYSLEELREMIQASAVEGEIPHRSTEMMQRALHLQTIPVSKIMTPFDKVEAVNLGLDPEQILDQVAEIGHTRVPVYRVSPKKIGGYLHAKDLLFVWRGVLPLNLDTLLRRPLYVSPEYVASNLLEDFRKGVSHLAVVTDAAGDCLGVVTLQDILDEIMGEIIGEGAQ
jgi:putative hemolysin